MSKGLFLLVPFLFALACGGGDGAEEPEWLEEYLLNEMPTEAKTN